MSAPSLFDRYVTHQVRPPAQRRPSSPFPTERDRRSRSAVAVLSREHDALCLNATDPLEIAAGLEAAGISDRRARAAYDAATVFELADYIYHRVPRRPERAERPDPWTRPTGELMARGLVYALPGLLLAGTVQHLARTEALLLLLVSIMGAAANQALSYLGHLLIGRRQLAGASTLLRHALVAAVLSGLELAGLALLVGAASWRGAAVAALAATYLASATVVLLLDRHRLLLALLAPAGALAVLAFIPHQPLDQGVALSAAVASVLGAFVTAWRLATQLAGPSGPAPQVPLSSNDLWGCLPQVFHGALSMSLLSLIPLASLQAGSSAPEALGPVMLPAVLSLGAAEVHLYGFRRRASALLDGHHLVAFASAVRLHLLRRVASYTTLLVGLTLGVALFGQQALRADVHATAHLATFLLLAVGLFLASLLISTSHVRTVALVEGIALAMEIFLQKLPDDVVPSATGHLLSAGVLAVLMIVVSTTLLGRVVSHR